MRRKLRAGVVALMGFLSVQALASSVLEVKGKVYSTRPDAVILELSPKMGWVVPKSAIDPKVVDTLADRMGKEVTFYANPAKITKVKLPLEPADPVDPDE